MTIIFDGTNNTISGPALTLANTNITGSITSSQIASVSNTQITGVIAPTQMYTGAILQVVQSVITTQITASSDTWTNLTSATITPKSSTNKILIILNISFFIF